MGLVPPEVYHHHFCLLYAELRVVLSTPLHKSVYQVPVLIFLSILHTLDYCCVIWGFLQMTQLSTVLKIISVDGEEEEDSTVPWGAPML